MSRKLILAPTYVERAHSLTTSFNSTPTIIDYMDDCSYQINITTSNSTGTFAVQASLDYVKGSPEVAAVVGNWITLSLAGSAAAPTVAAANDNILINMSLLPFRAIRIAYTASTPGTGTCDIIVMNKAVGS